MGDAMKFLIQHNLMNEDSLLKVKRAVEPYPHEFVGVIPFSREITGDFDQSSKDYIPYGSTLFTNLADDLGWKGLHFDLSRFNYVESVKNRNDMLNAEMIMTVKEAALWMESEFHGANQEWFIRPSEDLKHFPGQVIEASECSKWLYDAMSLPPESGTYAMDPDMQVVIAEPKNIQAEWRWFIVDGKIIDGSMYRHNGRMFKKHEMDQEVINEAQQLADIWLPDSCVVMDTALVNFKVKVIEFNCINSSGFYDHDVNKIFEVLWAFHN
jgi:hypothetical protein